MNTKVSDWNQYYARGSFWEGPQSAETVNNPFNTTTFGVRRAFKPGWWCTLQPPINTTNEWCTSNQCNNQDTVISFIQPQHHICPC